MAPNIPVWKRALDLPLSISLILVLSPLIAFIVVSTAFLSPGPVLFRQERIGHNGRRFTLLKFRTMIVGASTSSHETHLKSLMESGDPLTKLDAMGDSRLTPGAWFLRATGLDELPQVINVIRGDMSLVGPRPCLPYEYEQYEGWQKERLSTPPGLTGLWQVSGKNRTTFEEMMRLDIDYARRKSLLLDLGIMLRTLPALVGQVIDARVLRRASDSTATHETSAVAKAGR